MQNTAKILEGQSLFDWCLVHTGVVSSLFDVMERNGLTSINVLPGTELIIPSVLKPDVVAFFSEKQTVSIPAEALPSNLNEVTIQALNSLDEVIASGSYFFGSGTNPIHIPDSEIKLNDENFLSIPATKAGNIELINQDYEVIVPQSIIGNVIKVETGVSLPMLPSGEYTPVNTVSGPYDLEWIPSADVVTSSGQIDKNGTPGIWAPGAKILLNHNGDFTLRFKMTGDAGNTLLMFGLSYYYSAFAGDNYYFNLGHCFYRNNAETLIFEYNHAPYTYSGVNDSTVYEIARIGLQVHYKINGATVRTVDIIQTAAIYIDSTLLTANTQVYDITINI